MAILPSRRRRGMRSVLAAAAGEGVDDAGAAACDVWSEVTMTKRKKKQPQLTEVQAWRVIALMFYGRTGLCGAIHRLYNEGLTSRSVMARMDARVERERRRLECHDSYLWPLTNETNFDQPRVKFASAAARSAARSRRHGN